MRSIALILGLLLAFVPSCLSQDIIPGCAGEDIIITVPTPPEETVISWLWYQNDQTVVLIDSDSIQGSMTPTLNLIHANSNWDGAQVFCSFDYEGDGTVDSTTEAWTLDVYNLLGTIALTALQPTACFDEPGVELEFDSQDNEYASTYEYTWLTQINDSTTTTISQDSIFSVPTGVAGTFTYQLSLEHTYGCGFGLSEPVQIEVFPPLGQAEIFGSAAAYCNGGTAEEILSNFPVPGGSGSQTVTWYVEGANGSPQIAGLGQGSITPTTNVAGNVNYFMEVVDDQGCGSTQSSSLAIETYPVLTAPEIQPSEAVYCLGSPASDLALTSTDLGGSGFYTFTWEQNQDNDAAVGTGTAYTPPTNAPGTINYNVRATDILGCGDVASNLISVTVFGAIDSVGIGTQQNAYCWQEAAMPIALDAPVTGGSGSFAFNWTQSNDDGEDFFAGSTPSISPETSDSGTLTYTLEVVDEFGCGSFTTNSIDILVFEDFVAPTIGWSDGSEASIFVCPSATPVQASSFTAIQGGSGSSSAVWEVGGNGQFSPIDNYFFGVNAFIPGTQGSSTTVRVSANDDACGNALSNELTVFVYTPIEVPTIDVAPGETTLPTCYGFEGPTLQTNAQPNTTGDLTYVWETFQQGGWTTAGGNTTSFNPGELTNTTEVRVTALSEVGCLSQTSASFTAEVHPQLEPVTLSGFEGAYCFEATATDLTTNFPLSGGSGNQTISWYVSDLNNNSSLLTTNTASITPQTNTPGISSYSVVVEGQQGCGTLESSSITIEVHTPLTTPVISTSEDEYCLGEVSENLNLVNNNLGGSGDASLTWEEGFNNNALAVGSSFSPPTNIPGEALYNLRVVDLNGCGELTSNAIEITTFELLQPGDIQTNQAFYCRNESAVPLELVVPVQGGSGNFSYSWSQESSSGTSTVSSNSTYIPPTFNPGTFNYQLTVTDLAGCGSFATNAIEVEVWEDLVAPNIAWSELSGTSLVEVCPTLPEAQAITNINTQGGSGVNSGVWQIDSGNGFEDNSDWFFGIPSVFQGAPGTTHDIQISLTDEFCGSVTSNVLSLYVFTSLETPEVSVVSSPTLEPTCFGFNGPTLATQGQASSSGAMEFVWETNDSGVWMEAGGNTLMFNPGVLTADTEVRVRAQSLEGCNSFTSSPVTLETLPQLTPSSVSSTSPFDTTCVGEVPNLVTTLVEPTGADGQFTHQWQMFSNGNWVPIAAQNELDFQPPGLNFSTQYRLLSNSDYGCGTVYSNSITLPVYNVATAPSLNGDQTICFNTSPELLVSTPAGGGGGNYSYNWEVLDDGAFISVGVPSLEWNPGNLTQSQVYRMNAVNGNGCGTLNSAPIDITVLAPFTAGTLLYPELEADTLCHNAVVDVLATFPTGATDEYTVAWDYSTAEIPWTSYLDGTTSAPPGLGFGLETAPLDGTTSLRVKYTSIFGCGTVLSNSIEIPVWEALAAPNVAFAPGVALDTICFGDEAPVVNQLAPATGSDNQFMYMWQVAPSETGPFTGEPSNVDSYLAGPLEEDLWVRQVATSEAGCGGVASDPVLIDVLPDVTAPTISNDWQQCYNQEAAPIMAEAAEGADNSFEYVWHVGVTNDNLEPQDTVFTPSIELGIMLTSQIVNLQAISTFGCGNFYSDTATVGVYDPISPGSIEVQDALAFCSGLPATMSLEGYDGGSGSQTFEWQTWNDDEWQSVANSDLPTLTTPELYTSASFRLLISDDAGCGDSLSNALDLTVYPRPPALTLVGEVPPCANSVDNQYLATPWTEGVSYNWEISDDGAISSGEFGLEVLVDWSADAANTQQFLDITQTFDATGCDTTITFDILPSAVLAPDPSLVVKKIGQDILVSADSSECATYRWGWRDVNTELIHWLDNGNEQYVIIAEFDPDQKLYFVDVAYQCSDEEATCPTRNWYNHDPFLNIADLESTTQMWPNPARTHVQIESSDRLKQFALLDARGQRVFQRNCSSQQTWIDLKGIPAGSYIAEIETDRGVERKKLLIQ